MEYLRDTATDLSKRILKCENIQVFFVENKNLVSALDSTIFTNPDGIVADVVKLGSARIYSKDTPNLNPDIDFCEDPIIKHYLCFPVNKSEDRTTVMGIRCGRSYSFEQDEISTADWIADQIKSVKLNIEHSKLLGNLTELLLKEMDVDRLLKSILQTALLLADVDRCSIFLHDEQKGELYSRVFDEQLGVTKEKTPVIRFPSSVGIAGFVARTGKYQLVQNAYEDERFNKSVDIATGYHTRNILCVPLLNEKQVVGVLQMVNKLNNRSFTQSDISTGITLGNLAGVALKKAQLFEELKKSEERLKVALEVIAYHIAPPHQEVIEFEKFPVLKFEDIPGFDTFGFDYLKCSSMELCRYAITIFYSLGLVERFQIPHSDLCHFVLSVSHGYRDVPYHNWMHAFSVTHFFFVISRKVNLLKYLHEFEILSHVISCLCHDIDHRGRNNAFQVLKKTPLAGAYLESIMEHHHFNYAVSILTAPKNNILCNLSSQEYTKFIQHMKSTILSTDLANHFKSRGKFKSTLAENPNGYHKENDEHRYLLSEMLMTCCDISSSARPWSISQPTSVLIYQEFFQQGDEEREMGKTPIQMMDRHSIDIIQQQIDFFNFIACFAFSNCAKFLPELKELEELVNENLNQWKMLSQSKQESDKEPEFLPTH